MASTIRDRFRKAWSIFVNNPEVNTPWGFHGTSYRPDRPRFGGIPDRQFMDTINNQLAIDVATVDMKHILVDENDQFIGDVDSSINERLMVDPNLDQGPTQFRQDLALTLFEKGVAAIVPVELSDNPIETGSHEIYELRIGEILDWYPTSVRVSVYDQKRGDRYDIVVDKSIVGIVTNPHYKIMNEPNSTLQRLLRKLKLLDALDERFNSGKLDIIIQLPYVIRTEAQKREAEIRRRQIEEQLQDARYGIAYTDGTEHITQLNRPAENNLLSQVEYLTDRLYSELGLTPEIFKGVADEQTMLNYFNRMIEPVLSAITEEMNRKFLTKTARTQGQRISFIRNPFKLIPINNIAEIADKFTRNEVLTSNEVRGIIGFRPSDDPKADELRNANIAAPKEENQSVSKEENNQNET